MKYFLLNSECYFVKGAVRGTIYNCHTGKVLSLDPQLTQIIHKSQTGTPLKKIPEYYNYKTMAHDALKQLKERDIGQFYSSYYKIEKIKPLIAKKLKELDKLPSVYNAFIELDNSCNLNCTFCHKNTYKVNRKTGCKRWPDKNGDSDNLLKLDEWKVIIKSVNFLGCNNLLFTGGEPLLKKDDLISLINYSKKLGVQNIKVFTNGLLLDQDFIGVFKENGVKPIIQVYSHLGKITDSITRTPGAHDKIFKNIHKLKQAGLSFKFSLIMLKKYSKHYDETMTFLNKFNPESIEKHLIYPSNTNGRGEKIDDFTGNLYKKNMNQIFAGSMKKERFYPNCLFNSCWYGKLAFTETGNMLPCPMARKEIIGNVNEKSFWEMTTAAEVGKYWNIRRDMIAICKDCEYRYFCSDCRPLEKSCSGRNKLYGRTKYCLYNPYTGQWGNSENE